MGNDWDGTQAETNEGGWPILHTSQDRPPLPRNQGRGFFSFGSRWERHDKSEEIDQ